MGEVYTEYPNSIVVVWQVIRVVPHLPHVTSSLCDSHVERGYGVGEPLWQRPDVLVHVATDVGVHLFQNEWFDAIEQEGSHGIYDSLQTRN